MATVLQLVNNSLRQIGEQPLVDTTGNLGALARQGLETALYTVVAETRHSIFLQKSEFTVTNADYEVSAFGLPDRCVQVKDVFFKYTGTSPNALQKLYPRSYDSLYNGHGYNIVGKYVYLGANLPRPFTSVLMFYQAPTVEGLVDAANIDLPVEVQNVVEAQVAAFLGASYLDDLAQHSQLVKKAEALTKTLRARAGSMRAPITWRY
jgi:hypothetical protein